MEQLRACSIPTRIGLLILLLAAAALRIYFVFVTPGYRDEEQGKIHVYNDEAAHLKYSLYLAKNHRFPSRIPPLNQKDPLDVEKYWIFNDFEYGQPPLYYVASVPFLRVTGNAILAGRLFSVALNLAAVCLAVFCSLRIFRNKELAALTTAVLVGFQPVMVRIGSTVSNDNLAWLLSVLLLYLFLRPLQPPAAQSAPRPLRTSTPVWLYGVLIGLGVLTRMSFLLWPVFLVLRTGTGAALTRYRNGQFYLTVRQCAFVLAVALLICGGWLVRNHVLYGDWSGAVAVVGEKGSYLIQGSADVINEFLHQAIRYTFFPVREEGFGYFPLLQAIVLFFFLSLCWQWKLLRKEFSDETLAPDLLSMAIISVLMFVYANLYWNNSETRQIFVGFYALAGLGVSQILINFKRAAPFVAGLLNSIYFAWLFS